MYECITGVSLPLYSGAVEWKVLRAHYERLFREAKQQRRETQETVAKRGGLDQNVISRLLSIKELGPQVENFVRAIEGLGITPSEFFRQIESQTDTDIRDSSVNGKSTIPLPNTEAFHGGAVVSPDQTDLALVVSRALSDAALFISDARARSSRDQSRDEIPRPRAQKSNRRRRRSSNR